VGKKSETETLITLDELENALGVAHKSNGQIPTGFRTSKEWAREWDTSLRTAQMRISEASEAGMVEMRKFRRRSMDGGNYYAAHYRITFPPATGKQSAQ